MPATFARRIGAATVLSVAVAAVTALFGVRATFPATVYYLLVFIQIAVVFGSAWLLGAKAIAGQDEHRRIGAAAALLLISPWLVIPFAAGFGTPWQATAHENQTRYLILMAATIGMTGGMLMLREFLATAGERFYSTLGSAAIILAGPVYMVWGAILFQANFAREHQSAAVLPPGASFTTDLSDVLLYFGGLLTYLAACLFAVSMRRVSLVGRLFSGVLIAWSLGAVLFLMIRGPQFPDPATALDHWYNVPGFIAGIPAMPWLVPCIIGISILSRLGREEDGGRSE